MQIIPIRPSDRIQMKKPHPCGGRIFKVLRAGSDVRVLCEECGRNMLIDRERLEHGIRAKLPANEN